MPIIDVEKPRPLHPTGIHLLRLVEVTLKRGPSFDGSEEVDRLLWRFVSNLRTEDGDLYEVGIFTGPKYGNPKSKMTWLVDMLRPGITPEQAAGLNTDELLGDYKASIKHVAGVRDPQKKTATFNYIHPVELDPADDADPFAQDDGAVESCEECGKELSSVEIKACVKRWGDALRLCTKHGKEAIARETAEKEPAVV